LPVSTAQSTFSAIVGRKHYFEIDKTMVADLRQLAVELDCTLHSILLATYRLLLRKYTGQQKTIIGIPVANRNHPDTINMQGMFVNNLPLVNETDGKSTIHQLILEESQLLLASMRHHSYPYYHMLEDLKSNHGFEGKQLFDTMFMYQNMMQPTFDEGDVSFDHYLFDPGFSKYALSLELFESGDQLIGDFEYDTNLFDVSAIEAMVDQYHALLRTCLKAGDQTIAEVHLLSRQQYQEQIHDFNDDSNEMHLSGNVCELFTEMVRLYPDQVALEDGDSQYTYATLNSMSRQIANALKAKGLGDKELVAVLMDRSSDFVATILGIMKSGNAYLPIDVTLPPGRIADILQLSGSNNLIMSADSKKLVKEFSFAGTIHDFELLKETKAEDSKLSSLSGNDLAYVIFTSGSTGKPKGVQVKHSSLANYTAWAAKTYLDGDECTFPLFTSVSFDLTITSLFVPLTTGNKVVVYRDTDPVLVLESVIADNQCEVLKLTPGHLSLMLQLDLPAGCKINRLIVGGEALSADLARDVTEKLNHQV
ncbi:MAG: AMP-binding protein, partial [Bacteroidota bacterium]